MHNFRKKNLLLYSILKICNFWSQCLHHAVLHGLNVRKLLYEIVICDVDGSLGVVLYTPNFVKSVSLTF